MVDEGAGYRHPAPERVERDADIALLAEYRVYARRLQLLLLPLYIGSAIAMFAVLYGGLAEQLAERQRAAWPYGVAMTAAVATLAILFVGIKVLDATLVRPMRQRWVRAAAERLGVDPESAEEHLF